MIIETFPVGPLQCNCTVLGCVTTRRAIVIDPGDEVETVLAALGRLELTVEAIIHTHAHLDHVGATHGLADVTGARVLLHDGDQFLYDNVDLQAQLFGFPVPEMTPVGGHLKDGEALAFGEIRGEILHTPGHTPGSLCLHIPTESSSLPEPRLFAGDTLFAGSIGRTDLWGGDMDAIIRSIRGRLLTLPDETVVVPGHGPATTIGRERRTNPFLT